MRRLWLAALVLAMLAIAVALPLVAANHNPLHSSSSSSSSSSSTTSSSSTSTSSASSTSTPSSSSTSTSESQTTTQPPLTNSTTLTAPSVVVCFEDRKLYGFCEPGANRRLRITSEFYMYITSVNGTPTKYRLIIDDNAIELGNGEDEATTSSTALEFIKIPPLRRAHLEVEVTHGGTTKVLDYGLVAFRAPRDTDRDAGDDEVDKQLDKLREFTPTEWTVHNAKTGLIGLIGVAAGLWIAYNRGREVEVLEQPHKVAE